MKYLYMMNQKTLNIYYIVLKINERFQNIKSIHILNIITSNKSRLKGKGDG